MSDWNDLVQAGKDAIEEHRTYDFDVVASEVTDPAEVERQVKRHFGKKARVTSTGNSVYIHIEDSRGWSHQDEAAMDSIYRSGLLGWFQRFLDR